jgi:hypothetical protein
LSVADAQTEAVLDRCATIAEMLGNLSPPTRQAYQDEVNGMSLGFDELVQSLRLDVNQIRKLYEDIRDQIPFPQEVRVTTGKSSVDGIGLFAKEAIARGEIIAHARIAGRRTPAGRYTNHSDQPNAKMVRHDDDILLVACADIDKSAEVLVDYRQAWQCATS